MNFDINKLLKDFQDSAKEFASTGLQLGSKALDYTATQLKTLQTELEKNAEKLAVAKDESAKPDEASK